MKTRKIEILALLILFGFFIGWMGTGNHLTNEPAADSCDDIGEAAPETTYVPIEHHSDEGEGIAEPPYSEMPLSFGFIGMSGAPAAAGAGGAGGGSAAGPSGNPQVAAPCPAGTVGETCSLSEEEMGRQIVEENSPPNNPPAPENGIDEGNGDDMPAAMLVPEFPVFVTPSFAIIGLLILIRASCKE